MVQKQKELIYIYTYIIFVLHNEASKVIPTCYDSMSRQSNEVALKRIEFLFH